MIYEDFYSAQEVADVLFKGNRTLHHDDYAQAGSLPKSSAGRPLSVSFVKAQAAGEEKSSLKSAGEYLSFLGYNQKKIAIFNMYVNEVVNLHLTDKEKPAGTIERSENFYAGVHAGGKSLNTPEIAEALASEFIRRLEISFEIGQKNRAILLTRREAPSWKNARPASPAGHSL